MKDGVLNRIIREHWLDKAAKQGDYLLWVFLAKCISMVCFFKWAAMLGHEDLNQINQFLTSSAKEGDEYSTFLLGEIYSMPSGNPVFSLAFFKWAAMSSEAIQCL